MKEQLHLAVDLLPLDEGMRCKLTLVSAPAGSGKTTLLSEWAQGKEAAARPRVAWLSLDPGDNDPARFWAYLVAAIETVHPGLAAGAQALSATPQPVPLEAALTVLINDIAALPGSESFGLVLDDYHFIDSPAIHDAVAFILEHMPGQIHLFIVTRADPPLPLAVLRARGELVELREADLHFTTEEATAFLNRLLDPGLSPEDVAALERRTEGWITGLQLAAIALQSGVRALPEEARSVSQFIADFTGSHRYILDYLAGEVLLRQPLEVTEFLLRTSILERMCGPLCNVLTGRDDGQAMLERLEQANLFTLPLDEQHRWYRYHHIFADFLRAKAGQSSGQEGLLALHRRAAAWYEQNGLPAEAIVHALSAHDWGEAARLIEQAAVGTIWGSGQIATFLGWVQALPESEFRSHPRLCLAQAWTCLLTGRLDEIEPLIRSAETTLGAGPVNQDVQGEMIALRALTATFRGNIPESIRLSQQALQQVPAENRFVRGAVYGNLGGIYSAAGNVRAAHQSFEEAVRLSQDTDNPFMMLVSTAFLGEAQVTMGRLHEAERTYRQALSIADRQGARAAPAAGIIQIGLGIVLGEWNDLDGAAAHLREGIARCSRLAEMGSRPIIYLLLQGRQALARVSLGRGDVDGGLSLLDQAEALAHKYGELQSLSQMDACRAQLELARGKLAVAARWAREEAAREQGPSPLLRPAEQATLARVLIAQGLVQAGGPALQRARELLRRLQQAAEEAGWARVTIEALVLQALALEAQGNPAQALAEMEKTLLLAKPEGFVRLLLDETTWSGNLLQQLLHRAAAGDVAADYAARLLQALPASAAATGARPGPSTVEPLSGRELEVLRLVAAGRSNQEIAGDLVLALGTVKKHLNNIYGKLGVATRTQAVARAREIGLL